MKKNNVFCLFLIFFFVFFACVMSFKKNFSYAEEISTAKSMVIIDAESGRILQSKNEQEKLPMASTTKIITAYTVLKNCDNLNEVVEVSNKAIGIPGTSIYLKNGEKLTVLELLYGMMLPSGNDAATALAFHVGGSVENFAEMMKNEVLKIGALNSSFKNPHGLDEQGHYTTAYDLALITSKALEFDAFRQIVSTKNTKIKGYGKNQYRFLKNKNKLLNTLDGCIGVKTGYTDDAGRCLVSACERNGMRVVCVVLNCGPMFEESFNIISSAFKNYKRVELLSAYNHVRSLNVKNGRKKEVKLFTLNPVFYVLSNSEISSVRYEYDLPCFLNAPIKKEENVGFLKIYLKNDLLFSEKVYTMEEVKSIGFLDNAQQILNRW